MEDQFVSNLRVPPSRPHALPSLGCSGNTGVVGAAGALSFFMNELINSDTALHGFSFLIILISRLYERPLSFASH